MRGLCLYKFNLSLLPKLQINFSYESNDDELNNLDNEVDEIDYPPMFGKLRAAKSIDALNNSSSISSR